MTIIELVAISTLPFVVLALVAILYAGKAIGRAQEALRGRIDAERAMTAEKAGDERATNREGWTTAMAVEAVLSTEEWAKRADVRGLAKTEHAMGILTSSLAGVSITLSNEELLQGLDAGLTRARANLLPPTIDFDDQAWVGQEAAQLQEEPK